MVITLLPDEAVTKLYLKYHHLPTLQACVSPGVKDPQHLSHEEVEKVKEWFQDHIAELKKGRDLTSLHLTLVEAGVTDKEARSSTLHRHVLQRVFQCFCENLFGMFLVVT